MDNMDNIVYEAFFDEWFIECSDMNILHNPYLATYEITKDFKYARVRHFVETTEYTEHMRRMQTRGWFPTNTEWSEYIALKFIKYFYPL